ncbi:hypothetical protein N7495_006353 [Penicillium taxi]|uniref:uncharacterized protein n=1 Tax=Penicillium taxi TaxID=168475 RepID=UPI002545556D|nr:uncharacterized protein N7495_006353 [Penicillium taxi]KAJ5894662.1 hypothetical protein N7495_006353 [Penicillium taxi]
MFQCMQCDKSYQRKTHLLRHEATHTKQLESSCPICKKSFLKPEVTRRHAKICAKKHDQPPPPASKPGRKRQSCDSCFSTKSACDRKSPCSRCCLLGRECSFETQQNQMLIKAPVSIPSSPASMNLKLGRNLTKTDGPFFFLRHFANPSVKKDRLAIGETAKWSVPRNLETIYSHLEHALVPTDPTEALLGNMELPQFSFPLSSISTDDYLIPQYPWEVNFPSKLSNQLTELMKELVETSASMNFSSSEHQNMLEMADLTTLFSVSNISTFISAFFKSLHWHLPIIHFPTFDPGNLSNSLLLSIFLSGATYSAPVDGTILSPWLFDVAEEYIFRKLTNISTIPSLEEPTSFLPTIQLIQGALIMEMLQFSRDDMKTRRRIRIMRHPCLVSTIRSLGIFHLKRGPLPKASDDRTWRLLVAEEVCIRVACWAFLADGFLTVCFKNHPALSIFEMNCHLPWTSELWEADDAASFAKILSMQPEGSAIPPFKEVITHLLETPETEPQIQWSHSLSPENLLILIYALNSLAFQNRAGLLRYFSLSTIGRAAKNWKLIWDSVISSLDKTQFLHLGYPKHAEELWWLLKATLEIANQQDARFAYLDNTATDELANLNDFIQWCHRSIE